MDKYANKYIEMIKANFIEQLDEELPTDKERQENLEAIINKIYEDGYQDGANSKDEDN
jgi:hypothetical protein